MTQNTTQNTTSEQSRAVRERTYAWADPQVFATAARELDGLDFFKQLGDSELPPPPINATLGMALVEVSDGRAVFEGMRSVAAQKPVVLSEIPIRNHLRPGAHLVLAGILERQADELKAAYAPHVQLEVADSEDGWILMTAQRTA